MMMDYGAAHHIMWDRGDVAIARSSNATAFPLPRATQHFYLAYKALQTLAVLNPEWGSYEGEVPLATSQAK